MDVVTTRRNGEGAESELSVMIEPKEAYNAPEYTHTNVKILPHSVARAIHT
jgi:hypothetical protein